MLPGLGVLAFLGELVPLVEERDPGVELVAREAVTDLDVGRGALPEVLVEAAGEVAPAKGAPALAGGSLPG